MSLGGDVSSSSLSPLHKQVVGDEGEPTHYLKRVGVAVPGVVVYLA